MSGTWACWWNPVGKAGYWWASHFPCCHEMPHRSFSQQQKFCEHHNLPRALLKRTSQGSIPRSPDLLSRVRLKNKYFETSARSDSEASVKDPALSSYVRAHGGWCLFRDASLPHSLTVPVSGIPHQEDHQKAVFSPGDLLSSRPTPSPSAQCWYRVLSVRGISQQVLIRLPRLWNPSRSQAQAFP